LAPPGQQAILSIGSVIQPAADGASPTTTRSSERKTTKEVPMLRYAAAVAVTVVLGICASPPLAQAAYNGQQIALDYFQTPSNWPVPPSSRCARYGPPTNVTIAGHNQFGQFVTWRQNWPGVFQDRTYVKNMWWRGAVTVSWVKLGTSQRYRTVAFIPQYNQTAGAQFSFEMWPDVVAVDCFGSLRKTGTVFAVVSGDAQELWVCGGAHGNVPKGGLSYDEYWNGYDEFFYTGGQQTATGYVGGTVRSTYALGPVNTNTGYPAGLPALVTSFTRVPDC
jgi:hypothetical protein